MKCPHCLTDFHDKEKRPFIGRDPDGDWGIGICRCSACTRIIVRLFSSREHYGDESWANETRSYLVRPKIAGRPPVPPEVSKAYAEDYHEACLVIADSAKASAALSRRCLQHILRGEAKVKPSDLFSEIEEVISRGTFPSHIAEGLDAVRNIGNFAAHPIKSKSTGDIVPVEPGEADWNLDVLESLFDFYFVAPAKTKARKDALNIKLKDAGKPPVK
jgi:hypothetical protein